MALKVNSFSQVLAASSNLLQASKDYATALAEIRSLVDSTKSIWVGEDADAYRKKIGEAIDEGMPLDKVSKEIASHAATLESTSNILKKVSGNIKTAMG
jgi:nicotinate-nucleotide pyrophosphorylase